MENVCRFDSNQMPVPWGCQHCKESGEDSTYIAEENRVILSPQGARYWFHDLWLCGGCYEKEFWK